MKIIFTIILFLAWTSFSFSQLSGDLKKHDRTMISEHSFVLEGNNNGRLVFNIAVNAEGEVTSAKLDSSESTVRSTPSRVKAQKYVSEFLFEPGTHFPEFHQGKVIITMVKPK